VEAQVGSAWLSRANGRLSRKCAISPGKSDRGGRGRQEATTRSLPYPIGRLAKRLDAVAAMVPNIRSVPGDQVRPRHRGGEGAMGIVLMFLGVIFLTFGFFALHGASQPRQT
jgi:hypothetical protein